MIRVVLADDHTLVREGLRTLLAMVGDIELVGEAGDGVEAIRLVRATAPDVLMLDVRMPRKNGLEVLRDLAADGHLPATLVLTTFDDEEAALDIIAAGARGFLLKDVRLGQLVDALRVVAAGGTALRPGLSQRAERAVAERMDACPPSGRQSEDRPPLATAAITERERDVLRLMAAGYSNREIGKALFVAEGTVKNHVSNILTKLGARDRTRAVIKALELGCV